MEQLRDRIEELVKFTLYSHINEILESDLSLSKDFCSNLLRDDPYDAVLFPASCDSGSFEGVLKYPLFKRLASALYQSIISGSFFKTYDTIEFISEDTSLKLKEDQWNNLILENGTELINMLKAGFYEFQVQEPFFSLLKDGRKTIEGRCAGGNHSRIEPGALVLLNKCVVLEVQDVHQYASFWEMLEAESLSKVLPGIKTIEEGVNIYRKFYPEEKEMSNGVLAICVSNSPPQPYLYMANILSVKGSALTHGARALAKHAERSSNKYWGILGGNDDTKNRHAIYIISCLIASCRWSNVHIIPQHGAVYEIRMRDGYGARWSSDGTKFIGFLEPYTEEGHSKGWKH